MSYEAINLIELRDGGNIVPTDDRDTVIARLVNEMRRVTINSLIKDYGPILYVKVEAERHHEARTDTPSVADVQAHQAANGEG